MCRGRKYGAVVAVTVLAFVAGCNLYQGGESGSSELKRFGSEAELLSYFKDQIERRSGSIATLDRVEQDGEPGAPTTGDADSASDGSGPTPAPGDASLEAGGGYSGTTTQEAGVDEADVVKTDGTNLYVISTRNSDSVLRIVGVGAGGVTQLLSETPLSGYGRDLYLHDGMVVALTSGGGFVYPILFDGVGVAPPSGAEGSVDDADVVSDDPGDGVSILPIEDYTYERPYTLVTIVDVANPTSTQVLSTTKFDGTTAASRMIDGVLHLVLANYQDYYYDVMPRLGASDLDLSTVDSAALLPKYTQTTADGGESSGNVVTWENLYHPTDPDGFGVVTVVSLDVDNNAQFSSLGVVAEPGLIYSSTQALYLTDTNYDWEGNQRTTTDVYKLGYEGRGATPVATGSVPGRVLNQYSMGESNGFLRVASTIDARFVFDPFGVGTVTESQNGVYVLGQTDASLNVVGQVENIAPGESIQSARFIGDRGFLVTFRQVDPFFTMDLSDPTHPRVVGELKVPGFSTFLTPIDANHILAVGQYVPENNTFGNWGVQVSIFDVTDFANPTQMSNVIIGAESNTSAYSEALWDPKAFTYYADGGVVALPVSIYEYYFLEGGGTGGIAVDDSVTAEESVVDSGEGNSGSAGAESDAPPPDSTTADGSTDVVEPQGFEGVYVFSVSAEGGLTAMGRLSTRFDEAVYWSSSFIRGVFIGGDLFAVTDLGVKGAAMSTLSTATSEVFFGLPYDILEEPPLPVEPARVEPVDDGVIVPDDGGSADSGSGSSGSAGPTITP